MIKKEEILEKKINAFEKDYLGIDNPNHAQLEKDEYGLYVHPNIQIKWLAFSNGWDRAIQQLKIRI